jgi:hypothetical protein
MSLNSLQSVTPIDAIQSMPWPIDGWHEDVDFSFLSNKFPTAGDAH